MKCSYPVIAFFFEIHDYVSNTCGGIGFYFFGSKTNWVFCHSINVEFFFFLKTILKFLTRDLLRIGLVASCYRLPVGRTIIIYDSPRPRFYVVLAFRVFSGFFFVRGRSAMPNVFF